MPTVQTAITYESYPPAFYERLGATVEREAMDAIVKKRARQHTPFNRRASRALKDLLRDLEGQILISPDDQGGGLNLGGGMRVGSLTELHMSQLAGICEGYTVTGSPMNLPFTDANTVRDVIDRLKIADTARNDVEFAVATHVEPYGCTFVCSVWVYIVRLTKISSYQ
jgi:coiled-coil and C2 domain-containing protein 2A